jgi:hypothetical protein
VGRVRPDVETSAGVAATLEGDRTRRAGEQFFETAAAAADTASLETPADVDVDARPRDEKFSVYDSVSVSRDDRLVPVEGTLPTAELPPST